MVLKDGKAVIGISVLGGDLQDQTTLNCLLNHVEFGMAPAKALTVPRFHTGHYENSFLPYTDRKKALGEPGSLAVNNGVSKNVRNNLAKRGHKIRTTTGAIAAPVMIYRDPDTGMIYAAGDSEVPPSKTTSALSAPTGIASSIST